MGRVFITGDTHGVFTRIKTFCNMIDTSTDDIMVILGDVGLNFYLDGRDIEQKEFLAKLPLTFLCLHGNHEERAWNTGTYNPKYITSDTFSGAVWIEDKYPNIWFLNDIEEFMLHNTRVLAISGAYSIDKKYRLMNGIHWFQSEQIRPKEMQQYLDNLSKVERPQFDAILSHTCPFQHMPTEAFLPNVNQAEVDNRTEHFLEDIEKKVQYGEWYCGHFHINKKVDKVKFLFDKIIQLDC